METLKVKKTLILSCAVLLLHLTIFAAVSQAYATIPLGPLDVEADVGSIHLRGEIADFYILVSLSGAPIDATLTADLYYEGKLNANLTGLIQPVATGLYRIPYTIPYDASAGTYALVVNAYSDSATGATLKTFLLSQTLTGWSAWLTDIQNNIVTIKTDVNTIKVSLDTVNARITSIEGDIVTIQTDMGSIKTDIATIGLTLSSISGDIAIINTAIGSIQGSIISIQGSLMTINTNVGLIQVDIGNLNATLTSIQNSLVTIGTAVGTIETTVNNIELGITQIEGSTVYIGTIFGDLHGTLNTIEGDISTINTNIGTLQ
ncbi:MAG: hypothetical protein QW166_04730, partial [Candidatus Bathyarchaeia archaeon]